MSSRTPVAGSERVVNIRPKTAAVWTLALGASLFAGAGCSRVAAAPEPSPTPEVKVSVVRHFGEKMGFEVPGSPRLVRAIAEGTLTIGGWKGLEPVRQAARQEGKAQFRLVGNPTMGLTKTTVSLSDRKGLFLFLKMEVSTPRPFEILSLDPTDSGKMVVETSSPVPLSAEILASSRPVRLTQEVSETEPKLTLSFTAAPQDTTVILGLSDKTIGYRTCLLLSRQGGEWKPPTAYETLHLGEGETTFSTAPTAAWKGLAPSQVKVQTYPPGRASVQAKIEGKSLVLEGSLRTHQNQEPFPILIEYTTPHHPKPHLIACYRMGQTDRL